MSLSLYGRTHTMHSVWSLSVHDNKITRSLGPNCKDSQWAQLAEWFDASSTCQANPIKLGPKCVSQKEFHQISDAGFFQNWILRHFCKVLLRRGSKPHKSTLEMVIAFWNRTHLIRFSMFCIFFTFCLPSYGYLQVAFVSRWKQQGPFWILIFVSCLSTRNKQETIQNALVKTEDHQQSNLLLTAKQFRCQEKYCPFKF